MGLQKVPTAVGVLKVGATRMQTLPVLKQPVIDGRDAERLARDSECS